MVTVGKMLSRHRITAAVRRSWFAAKYMAMIGQSQTMKGLGMQYARPYYYLGGNWALTQLSTGQPFFVNTNDRGIVTWIILGGVWETFVDDVLSSYTRPGMTVIDVGANVGYYTVKLGGLVGNTGRVFAFEPNPEMTDFVERNIEINGFSGRCVLHRVAVGAEPGHATLSFQYANMGGAVLGVGDPSAWERSVQVEIDTIDRRLANLEKVDLFKIDAEGYEPLVLRGAEGLIARSPNCAYLIEVHVSGWERFGSIADQLRPIADGKSLFAVTHQTTLVKTRVHEVRDYLETIPQKMAYFFVCPETHEAHTRISRFIV